jgi:hypothetical protein
MSAPRASALAVLSRTLRSETQARAALVALRAAGYACVPIEPTPAMLEQGWASVHDEDIMGTWQAMVNAAESSRVVEIRAK